MSARTFWHTYLLAARRIRVDSRSRLIVFRVTFLCLYVMIWFVVSWIIAPMHTGVGIAWQSAFNGFILFTGFIAFLILRRAGRRESEYLNFSITGNQRLIPNLQSASTAVGTHLADRARILSALTMRAAAEIARSLGQDPDSTEGLVRQVQNGLLRQRQLWPFLESSETDLMASSEGTWTSEQQNQFVVWCEQLRLLRWVLGVDRQLTPLAHFPRPDFKLATGISYPLGDPVGWVASWDVRVERDEALAYAVRVVAEMRERNLIPESPELDAWTDHVRQSCLGESTDLLVGHQTVGSLSDADLTLFACTTAARKQYLSYVLDLLNGEDIVSFARWGELQVAEHLTGGGAPDAIRPETFVNGQHEE